MSNKRLSKIEASLKDYFCYYKSDNVLVVSEDKTTLPFAFFITENTLPKSTILALAIDYLDSITVAQVSILAATVTSVTLGDVFYISPVDGNTHFGEDAFNQWDLENIDLESLVPISEEKH